MCGIVGYSGSKAKAKEVILSGLEKLEYRGYDSSGIAIVLDNKKLFIEKKKGKLAVLKKHMERDSREDGKRSEEHTSELQSRQYLVCRLLLEKKQKTHMRFYARTRKQ